MTHMFILVIASIWSATLIIHARRLFRLAKVTRPGREIRFRTSLNRIWWWLGQEIFWNDVQNDGLRCVELTIMIFFMAWGMNV